VTDYYVPLSALVGSLNLNRIPLIGEAVSEEFEHLLQNVGVRQWHESWNDRDVSIRGTGVWGRGDLARDCGAFTLAIGNPVGDTAEFDFELSVDRSSLMTTALTLGEELAGVGDPSTLDDKLTFVFRADGPPIDFRLVLRGLALRVRFKRDVVRKGKVVTAANGSAIGIAPLSTDPANPVDDTADILILPAVIVIDSRRGFDFQLDDDELIEMPPLLIVRNDTPFLGVLVKKLKLDLSTTHSISEALAHGYDESWQGVFFEELAIFGLDAVFPTLPKAADPQVQGDGLFIDAKNWFLGTDGFSGSIKVAVESGPADPADPGEPGKRENIFRGGTFELEFDRGNMIRCSGEIMFHTHSLSNEFVSLGPNGNLAIGYNIRENPDGGLLYEFILRTPRPDDPSQDLGLFTVKDQIADIFAFVLLAIGFEASNSTPSDVAIVVLAAFTSLRFFDFKAITLDNLRVRRRTELIDRHPDPQTTDRHELRRLEFVLDVKIKIALDIPALKIPATDKVILPGIKTKSDHPLTLVANGLTFSWATNNDDFTEQELGDRQRFALSLDPHAGISFEIGDETIAQDSPFVLTKLGIGRWEQGLWFELGVKVSSKSNDLGYSVVPSIVRLWYLTNGDYDHFSIEGASFSLLIPKTIFARGEWQAGEITRITGRALILGWGASLLDYKDPKNWLFNVGFGMREQDLPPPPEPKRVTSRIVAFDFESSSGLPVPFAAGMSLYGISGLWAEHAQPALGGGTPSQWLTQKPPQYQVDIDKWEAAEGHSGWAAGVVIGSSVDHGRPWNLKAGFVMLKPGPVLMLFGTANFLTKRKSVKETNPAALLFYATLDLLRHEFLLGVRYDKKVPDANGRILKLSVPTELMVNQQGWHLYAGLDKPAANMVTAQFLSSYEISGYLMFDTATITNLDETGIDMPGFVVAAGVRFKYERGHKGSHYKLFFYLKAAADLAVSFTDPMLLLVRAKLAGGLVAKAWGIGFELELSAEFLWVRPTPDHLHGLLKATLDLPWPIPNLHLSIELTQGEDGDGAPIAGSLVDGLSLYLRSSQRSVEMTTTTPGADVPLDPIFSLAFKYPVRNGISVPGSFNISGGSGSTSFVVGGDPANPRGYVVMLDALRLWKDTGSGRVQVPGPFPALWRPDPLPAAGGKAPTRVLELFAYDGVGASRFLGASADYVDWAMQGFDPCTTEPPAFVCYRFDAVPLGPIETELSIAPADDDRVLRVSSIAPDGFALAESVRRYYAIVRTPAEVVQPLSGSVNRLIRLPATNGTTPPVAAGDLLQLRFDRANEVVVSVFRYPGGFVHMRGYLLDVPVSEDDQGEFGGVFGEDRFEIATYRLNGPIDRIEIESAHGPGIRLRQSLVVQVCLLYKADAEHYQDQQIVNVNWSTFWSDLLTQDAAASNALLLEPATHYTIEVNTSWAYLREDGSLGSPNPTSDTFSFTTVAADQPPASLRGPASALEAGDYEVRTIPSEGERAVYNSRPIRLEFRDARTDKLFGAFGQRLVLRLVDEQGDDLFDRLDFLREHATDLPEYQRAWRDHVLGLPCADPGLDVLWSKGVAHFPSVLAKGKRYGGTLVMLPASVTDLSTVEDWDAQPVVYRFRFETSRYATFVEHAAAYRLFDEICDGDVDLAALAVVLNPLLVGGLLTDDLRLEQTLVDHLHLPPRDPATQPELVCIWRRDTANPAQVSLIALLFDGPEPFIRGNTTLAILDHASAAVPVVTVDQQSAARTLLLFPAGGSFGSPPAGNLSATISSSFAGANGQPATDIAPIAIAVPAQPVTMSPEPAP
jgi:hypothetical protein